MTVANPAESQAEKPFIRIYKKGQEPEDIFYWLSRPPIERIRAVEEIRKQYNDWKYGTGLEFQRVYFKGYTFSERKNGVSSLTN